MKDKSDYLPFEWQIADIDAKISALQHASDGTHINISREISELKQKNKQLTEKIFKNLTPAQIVQISRHPHRPHFSDYQKQLFEDFTELHGDRECSDGRAIIGG